MAQTLLSLWLFTCSDSLWFQAILPFYSVSQEKNISWLASFSLQMKKLCWEYMGCSVWKEKTEKLAMLFYSGTLQQLKWKF